MFPVGGFGSSFFFFSPLSTGLFVSYITTGSKSLSFELVIFCVRWVEYNLGVLVLRKTRKSTKINRAKGYGLVYRRCTTNILDKRSGGWQNTNHVWQEITFFRTESNSNPLKLYSCIRFWCLSKLYTLRNKILAKKKKH